MRYALALSITGLFVAACTIDPYVRGHLDRDHPVDAWLLDPTAESIYAGLERLRERLEDIAGPMKRPMRDIRRSLENQKFVCTEDRGRLECDYTQYTYIRDVPISTILVQPRTRYMHQFTASVIEASGRWQLFVCYQMTIHVSDGLEYQAYRGDGPKGTGKVCSREK